MTPTFLEKSRCEIQMIFTSYKFEAKKGMIDDVAKLVNEIKHKYPGYEFLNVSKFVEFSIHHALKEYGLGEEPFLSNMKNYFSHDKN